MNRDQKAAVVDEIAGQIEASEAVFAVDYRGISVPQAAALRAKLREADASFRITKNSLTELAADKASTPTLKALLDGPTALTFVRGDVALAAKALRDAGREYELLELKGGLMNGAEISTDDISALAKLPSRQVLYSQLVGIVASPITGVVRTLNALIQGLASQLGQIAEQGLVTGEAPAAEVEEAPAAEVEEAPAAEVEEAPAAEVEEAPAADESTETEPETDQPDASADGDDTTAEAE